MKNYLSILSLVIGLCFQAFSNTATPQASKVSNAWMFNDTYVVSPQFKNFAAYLPVVGVSHSVMMPCPAPIVVNLVSGACSAVVDYTLLYVGTPASPVVMNPNVASSVIESTSYCAHGQTKYSRVFNHTGMTNLNVTNVNIGVFQSSGSPTVTINFYTQPGGILLGSKIAVAPPLNAAMWNVPITGISIPANSQFRMEIVANIPIISVFKIGRNSAVLAPGYVESPIVAPQCMSGTPLNTEIGIPGTPISTVFGLTGTPDPVRIVNASAGALANLNSGDEFPIGVNNMIYQIFYGNGATMDICLFSITVNENVPTSNVIACHDLIHVTLGGECEAEVTAGMILQGEGYACYDDYTVEIVNTNGSILGTTVTKAQLGRKLRVNVLGPNGNSCWGEILVEDKLAPVLECADFYTTCSNSLQPGDFMNPRLPVSGSFTNQDINDNGSRRVQFNIQHIPNATVTDLDVSIKVTHPRLSDLSANITSPDGVTVPLFLNNSCTGGVFEAIANDGASLLGNPACDATTNNALGEFRPLTPLSIFNGRPVQGLWEVRIFDNVAGQVGIVNYVDLIFTQSGGQIPFPTSNEIEYELADPGNPNIFIVDGLDACSSTELGYTDIVTPQPCSSEYSSIIQRCWTAVDEAGNIADVCCHNIYVFRNGLSTLVFPKNYDGTLNNLKTLSCEEWGDEIPGVDITGEPTGDLCSNVQIAEPEDVIIDICPKSYKILRTHKVIEWCNGTVLTHIQVIKVEDSQGPELECPRDTILNTDAHNCFATYTAPRPKIIFECSGAKSMELSYSPFTNLDDEDITFTKVGVTQSTRKIDGLPIGTSVVQWSVTDSCGNTSTCIYQVTVEDKVRPSVVCDRFTTASITGSNGGKAIVDAFTFDDGSNDNCGILSYKARRHTQGCGFLSGVNAPFTPTVEFCCAEVGDTIMVEMQVTDVNNNSNTCMVMVRVDDKLPPYITYCPKDIRLLCHADFKDLKVTGEPIAVDNCEVVSIKFQDVDATNNCGVGTVTRTWTATDRQGLRHSCVQVITLVDERPFNPNTDLTWPQNYSTPDCFSSLHPDSLSAPYNRPLVKDDNCSLVAMHYKDTQFDFVDGACVKILRQWTVIDWCTYNEQVPVLGQGLYQYIQILKIQNVTKPTFDIACEDVIVKSYGPCRDSVNLTRTATDDCPEANIDLEYKYELFYGDELFPFETRNTNRIRKILADGVYRVRWTVEDKCGNLEVCTHKLTVVDSKKPTPVCYAELATAVMNSDGTVELWARDYDKGSYDNCTTTKNLKFTFFNAKPNASKINQVHYFRGDGVLSTIQQYNTGEAQQWNPLTKTAGLKFTCDDILNGISEEILLEMSVIDSVDNIDYCTVTLSLQDNNNACPNSNVTFVNVSGRVSNPTGQLLSETVVNLNSTNGEFNKTTKTNATGTFALNSVVPNKSYTLGLSDNRDILNGVSTLDLVMMQRHILGLNPFTDATKVIAADIDNNQKVTAADLVNLRKNILGISASFPNQQQSWRFVTADHVFQDIANPFPFAEQYEYESITSNKTNQNFIPIKIGDVNNSATYGLKDNVVESRSNTIIEFSTSAQTCFANVETQVPVFAHNLTNIVGMQGTFRFDAKNIAITNVSSGAITVNEANFGYQEVEKGKISFSFNDSKAFVADDNTPLFYITVLPKQAMFADQIFSLSSEITPVSGFDSELKLVKIVMRTVNKSDLELLQNTPNPFVDKTYINFRLGHAGHAKVVIMDINGRTIREWSGDYAAGEHQIKVSREDINISGVLVYQLQSSGQTITKKMILVDRK
jgi:Proprotein convertase P-domain